MIARSLCCAGLFLFALFPLYEQYNFKKVEWRIGPLITLENLSTTKPSEEAASTTEAVLPVKEEVCRQPVLSGLCYASIPRFHYNYENKTCVEFVWGGCNKNDNNFGSKEECHTFCDGVV